MNLTYAKILELKRLLELGSLHPIARGDIESALLKLMDREIAAG